MVRRPFPSVEFSLADTFLLLDHMGAVEYAPGEARLQLWVNSTANWCTRVRPGLILAADIDLAQQRWADFKARMNATHRVPPRAAGRDAP